MATTDHAAEVKPSKTDTNKERDNGTIGLRKNNVSPSASFASSGDQIVYSHNVLVPHPPAYYYGGYESGYAEWDEYSPYINPEGVDIRSPVYNENPSLIFSPGYGYSTHLPFAPTPPPGHYPPPTPPLVEPQIYSPQHYPFTCPTFYPHPYVPSPPISQPDASLDHQTDPIYSVRPTYPTPVGPFARGAHEMDRGWTAGLWSDWPKAYSPAVSPQPMFAPLGSNFGSGQRVSYYSGPSYHSPGRTAHLPGIEPTRLYSHSLESVKTRGRTSSISICGCDIFTEQNRGPRASKPKNPNPDQEDSPVKPKHSVHNENYNLPDFVTDYINAKFFIIKSYSEDNVHKSIKYGVWASTPNGNKRLDSAYREAQELPQPCPIFLLFSVNASGQFCGVAEMVGEVDFEKNVEFWQQDKWSGRFPVKWHLIKDVPNSQFRHILLENNDNKPVTNSRDTQEVRLEQGVEMLKLFKGYETEMSILDDFDFYEARQKVMLEQKAKQQSGVVGDGDVKGGSVSLSNEFVKRMSKSFAEAVLLDQTKREDVAAGSKLDAKGDVVDAPRGPATS